jgi:Rod binding domain-containing protein
MDISELLGNQGVAGGQIGKMTGASRLGGGGEIDFDDERRKKVAKDFESVFLHELLKKMEDTIPDSGMGGEMTKQTKGMYWFYMAQDIADKGGFGLWKDIYENMPGTVSKQLDQSAHQIQEKIV